MALTRHKLARFKQVSPKSTNGNRRCFQSRRKRESKQSFEDVADGGHSQHLLPESRYAPPGVADEQVTR